MVFQFGRPDPDFFLVSYFVCRESRPPFLIWEFKKKPLSRLKEGRSATCVFAATSMRGSWVPEDFRKFPEEDSGRHVAIDVAIDVATDVAVCGSLLLALFIPLHPEWGVEWLGVWVGGVVWAREG